MGFEPCLRQAGHNLPDCHRDARNQLLDPAMAFHPPDLAFASGCLRAGGEGFRVDQFLTAPVFQGGGVVGVALGQAFGQVGGMADVEAACGLTGEDVGEEGHEGWWS